MARNRVLIEFTKKTDLREAGDKLYVDPMSAESFCDKKKVAKRLTEKQAEKVEAGAAAEPTESSAPPATGGA